MQNTRMLEVDYAVTLKAKYAAMLFTYKMDPSGTKKVFEKLTENMRNRRFKEKDLPVNLLVVCNKKGNFRSYGVVRLTGVQKLDDFKKGPLAHRLIREQSESSVWSECYMIPEDGEHRIMFRDRVIFPPVGDSAKFRLGVWRLTVAERDFVRRSPKSADHIMALDCE